MKTDKLKDNTTSSNSFSPTKSRRKEKWKNLLKGKSFYIHLPESQKTRRLKRRLNILGGVVDKFFHRGISFVISSEQKHVEHKEYDTRNSPLPRRYNFGTDGNTLPRYATRASSILEKVKLRYSSQYHEVIKAAENWGIKVKSLAAVNQWLSVVEKRMKSSQTLRETPRVRQLTGTFIKIDDFQGKYRPLIKEFDVWPKLYIDSRACPFDQETHKKSKDSPKLNKENLKRKLQQRTGYCEPCNVTYKDLDKHINGKQHKTFARNKANFKSLDKLIEQGPSIDELRKATKRKCLTIH